MKLGKFFLQFRSVATEKESLLSEILQHLHQLKCRITTFLTGLLQRNVATEARREVFIIVHFNSIVNVFTSRLRLPFRLET